MVTLNDELQLFYNNINGKLNTLDSKASTLLEDIDALKKINAEFSESLSYYYKGKTQKEALKSISALNDAINKITNSINDKIFTSITKSKDIINNVNTLIDLKGKINSEDTTNDSLEAPLAAESTNYLYTFNIKQQETITKLKDLKNIDGLINPAQSKISSNEVNTSKILPGTYKEYKFTASNGVVDYYAYIPDNIDSTSGIPVHLHLWPSRKNGGPMGYYNVHGLPRILYEGGSAQGVVICPKLQANEVYDNKHLSAIKELSDSFINNYNCDSERISISGQCGGGQAAINIATKYPTYFSKVAGLYSSAATSDYTKFASSKEEAGKNIANNSILLIKSRGGGDYLNERSENYTNKIYNELKKYNNIDVIKNPDMGDLYGSSLYNKEFTYNGKTYTNFLEYMFAQTKN